MYDMNDHLLFNFLIYSSYTLNVDIKQYQSHNHKIQQSF
jgi:hypothetical protein